MGTQANSIPTKIENWCLGKKFRESRLPTIYRHVQPLAKFSYMDYGNGHDPFNIRIPINQRLPRLLILRESCCQFLLVYLTQWLQWPKGYTDILYVYIYIYTLYTRKSHIFNSLIWFLLLAWNIPSHGKCPKKVQQLSMKIPGQVQRNRFG